jgi:2-C-methyl-D-erythritol 4-phosphate cytidylyltransferase
VRFGSSRPKALQILGNRPLISWAVSALWDACDLVVVAAAAESLAEFEAAVPGARVVVGGVERSDSVRACLAVLPPSVEFVLVHDAARPLASADLAGRVLTALRSGAQAVVPAIAVVDTIKEIDEAGWVTATPDRSRLRAIQTPQGFARGLLDTAHRGGADATDDAGLIELLGVKVATIPGESAATKVTTEADLRWLRDLVVRSDRA